MIRLLFTLICFVFSVHVMYPQTVDSWEDDFARTGELEDVESASWEQAYDELSDLHENKLDLNRCTRQDLERLPFLSDQQIMDFIEYRDRARRIESVAELRMIPSFEARQANLLMQFAAIYPEQKADTLPAFSHLLRYGRHELVGMFRYLFNERKGDENGYLGYPYKHWLRYTFTSGRYVKAGLLASQDAGEPFFAGKNSAGYDFYSFYLLFRHIGRIKVLALGRYRLRFGMGLVVNNSFGLGKLNTLSTLGRPANHILAHSSRSEGNYLQGAAATVDLGHGIDLTAFASWRKIDATLNDSDATVATILRSGYHRTPTEMERRRNTSQTVAGGNINFFKNGFHVGLTGYYTSFNRALRPDLSQLFRRWYPQGSEFWNVGVDYGYLSHRLTIAGETATGTRGSVATINSVSYRLTGALSLLALQRYYPYQYQSLFAETFAEGGAVNDESGIFVGANWTPLRGLSMMAYTDYAYFAWPKYGVSQSSHSSDNFVQVTWERRRWNFLMRYRFKAREYDNDEHTDLEMQYLHRGRLAMNYDGNHLKLRTQLDVSHCRQSASSTGYMATQGVTWLCGLLRLDASVGYFHTDDYASRVYVYERGLMYQFSFPAFYGEGLRGALVAVADVSPGCRVVAKVGSTHYFDRQTIGSGLQQINGSTQTDMELQVRLKF
jgi:hypothetical protein